MLVNGLLMSSILVKSSNAGIAAVAEGVAAEAQAARIPVLTNRIGSMFTWFFAEGPITNWDSASKADTAAFGRFFRAMLEAGVWLPPSQFKAAFLGGAHTEQDVQDTIAAAREAFALVSA